MKLNDFWQRRKDTEEREVQNIKRRLRERFGGVFDSYGGVGAKEATELRRDLEIHRVAFSAAEAGRNPTKREIEDALRRLARKSEGIDRDRLLVLAESRVDQWVFTVQSSARMSPSVQGELRGFEHPGLKITKVVSRRDDVQFHFESGLSAEKIESAFERMFDQASDELHDVFQIRWARDTELEQL
jgi:hypothetical protein